VQVTRKSVPPDELKFRLVPQAKEPAFYGLVRREGLRLNESPISAPEGGEERFRPHGWAFDDSSPKHFWREVVMNLDIVKDPTGRDENPRAIGDEEILVR
jgi:hypothetical protein